jgi:hypothetical protein
LEYAWPLKNICIAPTQNQVVVPEAGNFAELHANGVFPYFLSLASNSCSKTIKRFNSRTFVGANGMSEDRSLSTGRLSEYPTDYFVGICIETSAMAEQNTLRLPRVDFSGCRLRLLALEE